MAKTALDLTGDELLGYDLGAAVHRWQASLDRQTQERWQQVQQLARDAAQLIIPGGSFRRSWGHSANCRPSRQFEQRCPRFLPARYHATLPCRGYTRRS
jgi:hypothetical protein